MAAPPIDPKDFYIHHRKNETIVRMPGEVHGLDLMIEDLDDCTVYILDHSAQITIDYCNRCRFVIGPVDGPLFIRNCVGCTVSVACRQLRTRECVDSDFFLYCATKSPIIESSHTLRFHSFNVSYPLLRDHFTAAKLDPKVNHNDLIYNFTAADASLPTPHWTFDKTVPALILLKLFDAHGAEIGGDATSPLADVYPSITEERVDKATKGAAASPAPATAAPVAASAPAPAPAAAPAPVLESFGSNSVPKFSSPAVVAATPVSADGAASSAAPFEAGVAPSIPSDSVASSASSEAMASAVVAELVDSAVAAAASEGAAPSSAASTEQAPAAAASSAQSPAAAAAPAASSNDTVIIKEASFSILTSAEEASKALFELAGVAYVPPSAATPAVGAAASSAAASSTAASATSAAAAAPAPTPSPPVDEEARLAAWFSSTPGMLAATPAGAPLSVDDQEQLALEARVAEAERKRLEALEQRRQAAASAAASSKAAASASVDQFYREREAEQAEQRKAMSLVQTRNTARDHAHRPNHSSASASDDRDAALLSLIHSSVNAAPSASSSSAAAASAPSSSSPSSAASAASSSSSASAASALDAGWSEVLSMLPAGSLSKHSSSDLLRMKLLYMQLKAAKSKAAAESEAKAAEEARRLRKEDRRRRKKEKKKKKRAKRREKKRAAEAARIAAIVAAGGTAPEPKAQDDGSSSDSSSSSSSDDSDESTRS